MLVQLLELALDAVEGAHLLEGVELAFGDPGFWGRGGFFRRGDQGECEEDGEELENDYLVVVEVCFQEVKRN